jgi:hypothetical protein
VHDRVSVKRLCEAGVLSTRVNVGAFSIHMHVGAYTLHCGSEEKECWVKKQGVGLGGVDLCTTDAECTSWQLSSFFAGNQMDLWKLPRLPECFQRRGCYIKEMDEA